MIFIKLSELLGGVCIIRASENLFSAEINEVKDNSNDVRCGDLFIALGGTVHDGFDYISKAIANGASAIVYESRQRSFVCNVDGVCFIETNNARRACAVIMSNYYSSPERYLHLVGVTGTNGKTTVCRMVKHILENNGIKCGIIGTLGNGVGDDIEPSAMTTPPPSEFYRLLDLYRKKGAKAVVSEVSSHALKQDRVASCTFDVGALTNISTDHLDFHKTAEDYISSKCKLFTQSKISVLNGDDPSSSVIARRTRGKKRFYSEKRNADIVLSNICDNGINGVQFDYFGGKYAKVKLLLPGRYNVHNAACAIGICEALGVDAPDSASALESLSAIKGRCEVLDLSEFDVGFSVVIDFAHTPDALLNILNACRSFTEKRLISVFGCGGDRDKTKRPEMGRISSFTADFTIVTSDNPRTEMPEDIISDILKGIDKTSRFKVITDRSEAIRYAIDIAGDGDVIVLAGKGHEEYEINQNGKIPYSEKDIVFGYLKGKTSEG